MYIFHILKMPYSFSWDTILTYRSCSKISAIRSFNTHFTECRGRDSEGRHSAWDYFHLATLHFCVYLVPTMLLPMTKLLFSCQKSPWLPISRRRLNYHLVSWITELNLLHQWAGCLRIWDSVISESRFSVYNIRKPKVNGFLVFDFWILPHKTILFRKIWHFSDFTIILYVSIKMITMAKETFLSKAGKKR